MHIHHAFLYRDLDDEIKGRKDDDYEEGEKQGSKVRRSEVLKRFLTLTPTIHRSLKYATCPTAG